MLLNRRVFGLGLTSALCAWPDGFLLAAAAIKALKPGEFVWRPEVSPHGPVVIVVSLPEQLVHVYRNGITIGVSTCSTGKAGHKTPTGVFTILQKRKEHYSSTYNNAPMPNMQRLTWKGIALHAGNLPGYPASHGCVRLPKRFSELLFSVTQLATPVIIADQKTAYSSVVRPDLILPKDMADIAEKAQGKGEKAGDKKDVAEEVTESVLISAADQKAYLMGDGEIKYETAIRVVNPGKPLGTHLFSLIGPSPDGFTLKWSAFGFGGKPEEGIAVDVWSSSVLSRIEFLDGPGVRRVAKTLKPGTIMVITDFAAMPETRSAPDFTVITEDEKVRGNRKKG